VKGKIDSCLTEDDAHLLGDARSYFSGGKAPNSIPSEAVRMIAQHHNQTSSSSSPYTLPGELCLGDLFGGKVQK